MREPQKFYRTTITFEVLSNEPIEDMEMQDIVRECIEGRFSGDTKSFATEEVSKERMAKLLEDQRSDPSFLIDDDEEEWEEDREPS